MPLAAVIALTAPVVILGIVLYLNYLYGDGLEKIEWPGHNLNEPDDPRLVKLDLRGAGEEVESGRGEGGEG